MDFLLSELNSPCGMELNNCIGILVRYRYIVVLVLDTCVDILVLYQWIDWNLLLYSEFNYKGPWT